MLIEAVDLENIKSYQRATIEFAAGTNAICGSNGAGKSTIIEAVGFALFGSQRARQEQLIRAGESHGRIEVRFTSSFDGLPYYVVRELRRTTASSAVLHSLDLGAPIASGVREVHEQLVRHLGLNPGARPATIFEGVVGVPQGQLTADFLLPPTPRKARFEELLALQEFEAAYHRLGRPSQWGQRQLSKAQGRLESLQEQLRERPELEGHREALEGELEERRRQLQQCTGELAALRQQRGVMDESERALAAAREDLAARAAARQLAAERLSEAERRYEEALEAAREAEATAEGRGRYLELHASVTCLEREVEERNCLREEQHRLRAEIGRHETALQFLQQSLLLAQEAEQEVKRLEPLAGRQAELEGQKDELDRRLAGRENLLADQKRLEESRSVALREREELEQILVQLDGAPAEAEELSRACDSARRQLVTLEAKIALLEAEKEAQQHAAEAVARGESDVCPACQRPFEEGDAAGFLQHLSRQIAEAGLELTELRGQQRQLALELEGMEQRLRRRSEAVESLRHAQVRLQQCRDSLARFDAEAREIEEALAHLQDLDRQVEHIGAQLGELGDARSALHSARARAQDRARLEREASSAQTALASLAEEARRLDQSLAPYHGIDERLRSSRAQREEFRADYDRFERAARLAAERPGRKQEWRLQMEGLERAEQELDASRESYESLVAVYDADEHRSLREQERRMEVASAESRSTIASLEVRLAETRRRLDHLDRLAAQYRELELTIVETGAGLSLLRFLRDTIRAAGPEMARRMRHRVSHAASSIFTELLGDYVVELEWEEDYGIGVRRGSDVREFAQLSGGEQMMAALALRLALLRELSDIGIAFFDEPTMNLDEEHRRSLADQIRRIRGFQQLFVISHDDALESVTDSVIRVHKEDGISRVEGP